MMKTLAQAILVVLFILNPNISPAPIFGGYPGIDKIIEQSDSIIVGEIVAARYDILLRKANGKYDPTMGTSSGMHEDNEVRILRTIKGNLKEKQTYVIGIRGLMLPVFSSDYPMKGAIRLLFLQNRPPFSPYVPEYKPAVAWTQNCAGADYPVNPKLKDFPFPKKSRKLTPKEQVLEVIDKSLELNNEPESKAKEKEMHDLFLNDSPAARSSHSISTPTPKP